MEGKSSFKISSTVFKMGKYTFEYPKDHPKKKPIHKQAIKGINQEDNNTLDISNFLLIYVGESTGVTSGTTFSSG
jgi:hypothetical protein